MELFLAIANGKLTLNLLTTKKEEEVESLRAPGLPATEGRKSRKWRIGQAI